MSVVVFVNPGELDPRLVTTFGVNVKLDEGAVGTFGTGLKYAIAILLRLQQEVTIHAGSSVYRFTTRETVLRGKTFQLVVMERERGDGTCDGAVDCGFTTEYGKNWEPWMAYRELYYNCLDERGHVFSVPQSPDPVPNETHVVVTGDIFMSIFATHGAYFISDRARPIAADAEIEVHAGGASHVYYRGVRAHDLPRDRPAQMTWNVKQHLDLTEDRLIKYGWMLPGLAAHMVATSNDAAFIKEVVSGKGDTFETALNFKQVASPSPTFLEVVGEIARNVRTHSGAGSSYTSKPDLNVTALALYESQAPLRTDALTVKVTGNDQTVLTRASAIVARALGIPRLDFPIVVAKTLGPGVDARVHEGRVLLAEALLLNADHLAHVLLLRSLQHLHGYKDHTPQMQDHLARLVLRAMPLSDQLEDEHE